MLKTALFDCVINEKCCSVNGGRGICTLFSSPPWGIWQLKSSHPREFAISRCFSLLLLFGLSLNSTSQFFFRLPLCECPSALSRLNVCSFVSKARVFFAGNFNCNLTSWLVLLFSRYTYAIASQFYFALRFLWDVIAYIIVSIWIYILENFRNLQVLWKQVLVLCNTIHSRNFHHGSSSHVLSNKKFMRIMFAEKRSPILRETTLNFKERAKFPSRIKTIVSRKFSRITNAISEQNISHVTDGRVCYNWSL